MIRGIVFLAVDGLNLIRRVYAGTPAVQSALGATLQSLRRALLELSPSHAVVVFDGEEPTWRHHLYEHYKAGRKPMPEELRRELVRYRGAFLGAGVPSVDKAGLEADDVISTLVTGVAARGGTAVILSTDTVFCQLLSDRIVVRDHFQKRALDEDYVRNKFGIAPSQLVDLWALAGSATTNIPGLPGIGVKTAARLLEEHGSLARVLGAAARMEGKLGETLRGHEDLARLSRELARLRCDLELGWNLKSFRFPTAVRYNDAVPQEKT
ncbi:MAG: flap endonuclease Xni [Vicinamibacteria bacterium]